MISSMAIAAGIKKNRLFRNYSQDYLGHRLGISQNAYSKIELGITEITLLRLSLIAEVLEIDLIELIRESQSADAMHLASISA